MAQESSDSTRFGFSSDSDDRFTLGFDKQLNTYSLSGQIDYSLSSKLSMFRLREDYHSTFIESSEKNTRDIQLFDLIGLFTLNEIFSVGLTATSNILSDSRKIQLNSASTNSAQIFLKAEANNGSYAAVSGGLENNRQIDEDNSGPIYEGEIFVPSYILSGTNFSFFTRLKQENISPRKNQNNQIKVIIKSEFDKFISNEINSSYSFQRIDFFIPADSLLSAEYSIKNNIQTRSAEQISFSDYLTVPGILRDLTLSIGGNINYRTIRRRFRYLSNQQNSSNNLSGDIRELRFEVNTSANYTSETIQADARVLHSEKDERHSIVRPETVTETSFEQLSENESKKNNISKRSSIALNLNIKASANDELYLNLSHYKLLYDTPSKLNSDDRDELLSIGRVGYSRRLSHFFSFNSELEANFSRLVYLFAEKSSNNTTNRVLRLKLGGKYMGKQLSSSNSFEVSANYTVYDFEDLTPNYKSYTFRQMYFQDSTHYAINKIYSVMVTGFIKSSEQGDLNWKGFTIYPQRYLEEKFIHPKFIARFRYFSVQVGYRTYSVTAYRYTNNERQIDTSVRSSGPSLDFYFKPDTKSALQLRSWYEFIFQNAQPAREQINLTLDLSYYI